MNLKRSYYDRKFARISKRLRYYPRGRSSQDGKWDLFEDLTTGSSSNLFLGAYGDLAIMDLLGEFGILDAFASHGIENPRLDLDLTDAYRHILRLYDGDIDAEKLTAELIFRTSGVSDSRTFRGRKGRHSFLHLEWILLQNPYKHFDEHHPAMPDQEHPGLGMGDMTLSLLTSMAKNLHMSGIVTVPANLHSALFFQRSYLAFSARTQAELLATRHAAKRFGRVEVVWCERWGDLLYGDTNQVYKWDPSEMMQPLHEDLRNWLEGDNGYQRELSRHQPRFVIREGVQIVRRKDGQVERSYPSNPS